MRIKTFFCIFFLISVHATFGQKPDPVSELVATENYFAALVKEKGIKDAFLKFSDPNTILYRPAPVKAVDFFKSKSHSDSGSLSWEPHFARVSKSEDWGFTSGSYIYKTNDSTQQSNYGDYVSVWKKNSKGQWKLVLDLGVAHSKPKKLAKILFINPVTDKFMHQQSSSRLQQRDDIVLSSDKLYGTILKASNKIGRKEFLNDDTRLLFPGEEPIIGKKAVSDFWDKLGVRILSQPQQAGRAYSGELAYTRGESIIYKNGVPQKYYYVRLWEIQPEFKWNIILEALVTEPKDN